MEDAHVKTVVDVAKYFDVDPERGLDFRQIRDNQLKHGPNGNFFMFKGHYINQHMGRMVLKYPVNYATSRSKQDI